MKNTKNDDYTICFRYIILILKILGVFPFFPIHEVINVNGPLSTILTIISVSMFVATNAAAQSFVFQRFIKLLGDFSFTQFIVFMPSATLSLLVLIIPPLTWSKNEQLKNYRKNWIRFQEEMETLTRIPFECSVKTKIHRTFAIGIICMSTVITIDKVRNSKKSVSFIVASTFTMLYLMNGTTSLMMYWVVNNMYAKSSAKKIVDLAQQTTSKSKDVDLRRLITLWIMLCDLNEEFVSCHSILFLIFFGLITITGIVGAFSAVNVLLYYPDKTLAFIYFGATVICVLSLMVFCESANSVTKYMVYELRKALLSGNVITKNKFFLQVIFSFLQTIETKSAQITFNGFMPVDRSLILQIFGTAVNFLVVLKQFSPLLIEEL